MSKVLSNIRYWLLCKALKALSPKLDYSIRKGDIVVHPTWTLTPLEVVDVNWALRAVALRLGPKGGIVVWPISNLRKVESSK